MKKQLILLAAGMCFGLYSFAQVSFGVKAGFSGANLSSKFDAPGFERKTDTKWIPAFHAGVIVDITLTDNFSLQPGLFYSAKGNKRGGTDSLGSTVSATTRLNYLELPLNVLYKHSLGKGRLFAGLGPYLAYGISGKVKWKNDYNDMRPDINEDVDVKFKNEVGSNSNVIYVKPLDAGANVTIGYEMDMGLLFSVNYSQGLVNTSPYSYEIEKNRYIGISVGYLLKK
ncbi:MAG TPA: porin family protein [Chitinophaga sp.]